MKEDRQSFPAEAGDHRHVARLRVRLRPIRKQLDNHALYRHVSTIQDLCSFFESHVFAVWDFMSLLKTLQQMLTCVRVPWVPTQLPACRRLVNDIVLGEESDEYNGTALSHFELYRKAMQEAGANVDPIDRFVQAIADGRGITDALCSAAVPDEAVRFVDSTFAIIRQGKPHIVAAAFTFGREDLIPDMFRSLVSGLSERFPGRLNTFLYYLERHIGVDGDHHGPMALRMMEELCADDEQLWQEATQAAEHALSARLALWTAICSRISLEREHDSAGHLIAT